jgi:hypothetical protein
MLLAAAVWPLSRAAAAATIVLLLTNTGLDSHHYGLWTESLTATLLVLHLAAVARIVWRPSVWALCAMGATAGAAVLIRPACWFLMGGLVVLAVASRRQWWRPALFAGGSMLALVSAGAAYSLAERGVTLQQIGGVALAPHVVHLYDPAQSWRVPDEMKGGVLAGRAAMMKARAAAKTFRELRR